MSIRRTALTISAALTVAAASSRADFKLPLELRPNDGKNGMRCISNGRPVCGRAAFTWSG